jgi:hypothetical protein
MGLHTTYLGRARITPALSADEVEFVRAFNHTRHCGDRGPLDVVLHPADDAPAGDVEGYNRGSRGMPGLWCPWTACGQGCCLHWDGAEKPYSPEQWLRYVIDTFLRPGAALADNPAARRLGLTFDHVLEGVIVGERQETTELFALEVRDNVVTRRVLVPGLEGTDDWGYRAPAEERQSRQDRIEARRRRFEAAIAEDLARAG